MKKISELELPAAVILKPAEMNKIHFGGNRTPLTPEQLQKLAAAREENGRSNEKN